MAYANYTVTGESRETWTLRMDTAEASAPIYHVTDDGERFSTPYQTASARHCEIRAAEMLAEYWGSQSGDHDAVVSVEQD